MATEPIYLNTFLSILAIQSNVQRAFCGPECFSTENIARQHDTQAAGTLTTTTSRRLDSDRRPGLVHFKKWLEISLDWPRSTSACWLLQLTLSTLNDLHTRRWSHETPNWLIADSRARASNCKKHVFQQTASSNGGNQPLPPQFAL